MYKNNEEVKGLLAAWQGGDRSALERLLPLVDGELHRIARHYLRHQHHDDTLQSSDLVNEVHIQLRRQRINCPTLTQFFGIAAQTIRRILVDYSPRVIVRPGQGRNRVALNDALQKLSRLDPLKASIVELQYFTGLSVEEISVVLNVSPETVSRECRRAKAFLRRELLQTQP